MNNVLMYTQLTSNVILGHVLAGKIVCNLVQSSANIERDNWINRVVRAARIKQVKVQSKPNHCLHDGKVKI